MESGGSKGSFGTHDGGVKGIAAERASASGRIGAGVGASAGVGVKGKGKMLRSVSTAELSSYIISTIVGIRDDKQLCRREIRKDPVGAAAVELPQVGWRISIPRPSRIIIVGK